MNKILLLILTVTNYQLSAGEEEGTGTPSNNSATSNKTVYQLVCTSEQGSTQQDNSQYCVLVPVLPNDWINQPVIIYIIFLK